MADLDTREKRASGIAAGLPWRWLMPLPDGTIGQADRQQVAYMYSGILTTAPAVDAIVAPRKPLEVLNLPMPRLERLNLSKPEQEEMDLNA